MRGERCAYFDGSAYLLLLRLFACVFVFGLVDGRAWGFDDGFTVGLGSRRRRFEVLCGVESFSGLIEAGVYWNLDSCPLKDGFSTRFVSSMEDSSLTAPSMERFDGMVVWYYCTVNGRYISRSSLPLYRKILSVYEYVRLFAYWHWQKYTQDVAPDPCHPEVVFRGHACNDDVIPEHVAITLVLLRLFSRCYSILKNSIEMSSVLIKSSRKSSIVTLKLRIGLQSLSNKLHCPLSSSPGAC